MTPTNELEDAIAAVFGRRYKMMCIRVPGNKPNFLFFESKTGVDKGPYRGCALVMRVHGPMGSPEEAAKMFWGDPKGIVLMGFDDVAAFLAADRSKFTIISERKGLYE